MPLWDNLARQSQAVPLAAPHGADDFVAVHDASTGAVSRTAVRNLRSRELFTVNMFTNVGAAPATTTATAPLRVFRMPYAFTITSVVLAAMTPPGGNFGVDVWNNGVSVFTGGNTLASNVTLGSGSRRVEVATFAAGGTFPAAFDSEMRFFVVVTQASIRMPQLTIMGYRD